MEVSSRSAASQVVQRRRRPPAAGCPHGSALVLLQAQARRLCDRSLVLGMCWGDREVVGVAAAVVVAGVMVVVGQLEVLEEEQEEGLAAASLVALVRIVQLL